MKKVENFSISFFFLFFKTPYLFCIYYKYVYLHTEFDASKLELLYIYFNLGDSEIHEYFFYKALHMWVFIH